MSPMPTPSEQKALAFVAIVIVLGGAVRVLKAGGPGDPTPAEQQALARQATAAESAASQPGTGKRSGRGGKSSYRQRQAPPQSVGGVDGVPHSDVRPDRPFSTPFGVPTGRVAFPPPSSRIDLDNRSTTGMVGSAPGTPSRAGGKGATPAGPVDLESATAAQIEVLPRIGPTLAARIVANRDSLGPFHGLDGLGRVKGIGPSVRQLIAPLVTFSGRPASFNVRGDDR
jgi:hypothetical protein